MITALIFAISMLAILQYSSARHIPGSLDVGGFTLANFAGDAASALRQVFFDTVWLCLLTAVIEPGARLSAGLCAGALAPICSVKSFILITTVTPLFLGEVVRTYSWIVVLGNNGFVNSVLMQTRHHRTSRCSSCSR